jgi:hypothetical protein
VFSLFVAHNILNRQWYKIIFKGTYTMRRIIMTAVNITLVFTMTTLLVTGLLQSRTVLAFLHLPGGMVLRQIHTTAAYWGLPLIGIHLGLNWGMVINGTRKMAGITGKNHVRAIIVRILALLFVTFGVWASFDRDMFSRLFLGFSFDYWDEERPAIIFFTAMFSIMAVYVFKIWTRFVSMQNHLNLTTGRRSGKCCPSAGKKKSPLLPTALWHQAVYAGTGGKPPSGMSPTR